MRPFRALLVSKLLVAAIFGAAGYAYAQDAIPETPPELRDFRLDPERAPPQPEAQPVVTPPPVVTTVPESQTPPAPVARAQPTRRQPEAAQPITSAETEAADPAQPQNTPRTFETVNPGPSIDTTPVATQAEIGSDRNYGLFGGIAAAILVGMIGLWLALRRRRRRREGRAYDEPAVKSAPTTPAQAHVVRPPIAKPVIANRAEPAEPHISLAFIPEKATISFTTLGVKGQLQIANESRSLVKDLQFRAGLISASNEQNLAMQAFYADTGIATSNLGEAKAGEKLSMSIELTVPLTEMQSFPLGDQRLLVPIMVAELAYKGDDGAGGQVRIALMLGREAKPPQPKMGPLRLDQGPRSFAPLGQRPLAA